jgi:hypothetical protein
MGGVVLENPEKYLVGFLLLSITVMKKLVSRCVGFYERTNMERIVPS